MVVQLVRRRFTVEDYYTMQRAGILSEDDRVELIEGEIVEKAPIGSLHAACVNHVDELFTERLGRRCQVRVQNPLHLSDHSEPEPDIALVGRRADLYVAAHPGPADALLVVEVSDTTLEYDRQVKALLYARAGVAELWIVNLPERMVEVHREPSARGYLVVRRALPGQAIAPLAFPEVSFTVDDLVLAGAPS